MRERPEAQGTGTKEKIRNSGIKRRIDIRNKRRVYYL